jgi:hypothetical protein
MAIIDNAAEEGTTDLNRRYGPTVHLTLTAGAPPPLPSLVVADAGSFSGRRNYSAPSLPFPARTASSGWSSTPPGGGAVIRRSIGIEEKGLVGEVGLRRRRGIGSRRWQETKRRRPVRLGSGARFRCDRHTPGSTLLGLGFTWWPGPYYTVHTALWSVVYERLIDQGIRQWA